MKLIRRSLLAKLVLAFWIVSISGILIVAVLAWVVSKQEFNRFVNDTQLAQGLADNLAGYYAQHGSFSGAESLLQSAHEQFQGSPISDYVIVDKDGLVLLSMASQLPSGSAYPTGPGDQRGVPIIVNNQFVARLLPFRPAPPPRDLTDIGSQNLQRINIDLFIGAAFATVLALLLAWIMARNIIRPLSDLNAATQSISQGDLEKQVAITTSDEIGMLAASFNAMVASLKRSRDLRRQMTADIAHELRNPLSIILGHSEALSEGVLPAEPETLDIIYDEASHLSRLVDDLRTLSLSEAGELVLQPSPISPKELLEHFALAYAGRAAEKGVSIQTDAPTDLPLLNLDVERTKQVLSNLMENSLKHTSSGGLISLRAALIDGSVEISVQDSGSGIPADELPFVFDRFYRGKQTSVRIQDGSGLGLAISRALVELHHGHISASSEPGKGTTITISLPIAV